MKEAMVYTLLCCLIIIGCGSSDEEAPLIASRFSGEWIINVSNGTYGDGTAVVGAYPSDDGSLPIECSVTLSYSAYVYPWHGTIDLYCDEDSRLHPNEDDSVPWSSGTLLCKEETDCLPYNSWGYFNMKLRYEWNSEKEDADEFFFGRFNDHALPPCATYPPGCDHWDADIRMIKVEE